MNLIIFGVLSPAFLFIPTFQPQPGIPTLTKLKQLDWVGAVLNAGLYTSFAIALTFGGATWAWNSGQTIGTLVACVVILIVFIIQQFFAIFTTPEHRLFPIELIAFGTMVILHITTACASTAMFVAIYYVPLMFQFSRGDSGLESAVRLMPFIVVLNLFIMGSGAVLPLVGYYMPFFILGGVFILIGGALMFTVKITTSTSSIYGYTVLIAIGAGLTAQVGYIVENLANFLGCCCLPSAGRAFEHKSPRDMRSWINIMASHVSHSSLISLKLLGDLVEPNEIIEKCFAILAYSRSSAIIRIKILRL